MKMRAAAVRDQQPAATHSMLKKELSPNSRHTGLLQVKNCQLNQAQKRRNVTDNRVNIADHIQTFEHSPDNHPFARLVFIKYKQIPAVILYTDLPDFKIVMLFFISPSYTTGCVSQV